MERARDCQRQKSRIDERACVRVEGDEGRQGERAREKERVLEGGIEAEGGSYAP